MNSSTQTEITYEQIAARAHLIWQQSGRVDGHQTYHWLRAERELKNERRYERDADVEPHHGYQGKVSDEKSLKANEPHTNVVHRVVSHE